MPTEVLPLGMPVVMKANQVYALPAVEAVLFTDAAAPVFTQSTTQGFIANSAVTLTGGAATVGGGFLKVGADTLVVLKRD